MMSTADSGPPLPGLRGVCTVAAADTVHTLRQACVNMIRDQGPVLGGLVVLQCVVYSSFFTTLIFTNHTFPNSGVLAYPSYRTFGEGRWMADLIIWLQGGSGVQPFQMFLAVVLQGLNGLLFARFVGIERRLDTALIAAFICLYPAFLDNYSFGTDHVTFAIADTLAIGAILYCRYRAPSVTVGLATAAAFTLSLACYQPKLALIGLLCLCCLALQVANGNGSRPFRLREGLLAAAYVTLIGAGGCVLYFLTVKLTVTFDIGNKAYVNSAGEMLEQIVGSYAGFVRYFTSEADYMPRGLWFLPGLCILLGSTALLVRAGRRHRHAVLAVALCLALIPVVLRASLIINHTSGSTEGRITYAYGYALAFFVACALRGPKLRRVTVGLLAVFVYFFIVVASQESNAAALKTMYDVNMINRIAARVESVADLYGPGHALVVFGHYPEFARPKYVRYRNGYPDRVHVQTFAFEVYRQPAILNFFLGRDVFWHPTPEQLEKAIAAVQTRAPWPSSEAVFELDGMVVVLMEKYRPGIARTWTIGQSH
jgi:Glucosyl transferase GtrII